MRKILALTVLSLVLNLPLFYGENKPLNDRQVATFAGGCFWGIEKYFSRLDGVVGTRVGYTGGHVSEPTYEQVCSGETGHAEAIEIVFDPERVHFQDLVVFFFLHHDFTQFNRQGPDIGSQYRSAIFFHSPEQEAIARKAVDILNTSDSFKGKVVTEIVSAKPFYAAEEYHQQYLRKNPLGYCSIQRQPKKVKEILAAALGASEPVVTKK